MSLAKPTGRALATIALPKTANGLDRAIRMNEQIAKNYERLGNVKWAAFHRSRSAACEVRLAGMSGDVKAGCV